MNNMPLISYFTGLVIALRVLRRKLTIRYVRGSIICFFLDTWPRWRVGRLPFCIGRLWQGIEAMFRGLIPMPYLLLRLRRSRVYGGFVCCFGCVRAVVSRHQFSFASGVGSFVRRFRFCVWLFVCVCHTATALLN